MKNSVFFRLKAFLDPLLINRKILRSDSLAISQWTENPHDIIRMESEFITDPHANTENLEK